MKCDEAVTNNWARTRILMRTSVCTPEIYDSRYQPYIPWALRDCRLPAKTIVTQTDLQNVAVLWGRSLKKCARRLEKGPTQAIVHFLESSDHYRWASCFDGSFERMQAEASPVKGADPDLWVSFGQQALRNCSEMIIITDSRRQKWSRPVQRLKLTCLALKLTQTFYEGSYFCLSLL